MGRNTPAPVDSIGKLRYVATCKVKRILLCHNITTMLYTPDERDTVHEERDIPYPVGGAPLPSLVSTEDRLLLSYYSDIISPGASPRNPVIVNEGFMGTIAIVDFRRYMAYFSVPISNETLHAHPLAYRGLFSYGVFRVENSSFIRRLVAAQYVHRTPFPAAYAKSKHYIFTFHDSLFEAVADELSVRTFPGSMRDAQQEMLELIRARPQ